MPLLGGLFTRKNKSSKTSQDAQGSSSFNSATADFESTTSSPTAEYITADKALPSSPNGKGAATASSSGVASSGKLRLPFGRKRPPAADRPPIPHSLTDLDGLPNPAYLARTSTGAASDSDAQDTRRLRPPPSKSAIFAAYADPNGALSTRSLPNQESSIQFGPPSPPPPPVPKKSSLFSWSKSPSSTSSHASPAQEAPRPSLAPTLELLPQSDDSSFNLKAFRHVRPPSPNASNASLSAPPIPRPRGPSFTSESSQRISVAAFREAQARRSLAGSPVPSARSPSPHGPSPPLPTFFNDHNRGRASPRLQPPQPGSSPAQRYDMHRRSGTISGFDSDSDESSEEEQDSDNSGPKSGGLARKGTVTQRETSESFAMRGGSKAKSEIGHSSAPSRRLNYVPPPRSQSGYVLSSKPLSGGPTDARPQSTLEVYQGGLRPRASVSTSALTPSAAAKRASIISATLDGISNSRHVRDSSISSNPTITSRSNATSINTSRRDADDSDSEDDAPLAMLVAPRRPGSAMSSASNPGSTRSHGPKPLIDIKELTSGKRPQQISASRKSNDGFTSGATLLSGARALSASPPPIKSPIVSSSPPGKFISPPSSPVRIARPLMPSSTTSSFESRNPLRQMTDGSALSSNYEPRRDVISDRLTRVVQSKVGSGSSSGSGTTASKENDQGAIPSPPANAPIPRAKSPVQRLRSTSIFSSASGGAGGDSSTHRVSDPHDEDLASLLGASIRLISKNGESESESEAESDSDDTESEKDKKPQPPADRIAPIPIKQRAPPPAFSVTSRPQQPRSPTTPANSTSPTTSREPLTIRQRSSTLIPSSATSSTFSSSTTRTSILKGSSSPTSASMIGSSTNERSSAQKSPSNTSGPGTGPRQRSSTMLPMMSMNPPPSNVGVFPTPTKPFAKRRESPASSTGDSSSTRAPLTPRDGSELGRRGDERTAKKEEWGSGVSGLGMNGARAGKHIKRRSVSFEEDLRDMLPGNEKEVETHGQGETRRKERRRSEARAAIELGNVINGRGPIVDEDDDEDDLPINQTIGARMSAVNPMMAMGAPMTMPMGGFGATPSVGPGWGMNGWQQPPQNPQMLSPAQFMIPQPADPTFFAAHQQAMMFAKQAYQMAVAQQAMAAAGDEWERGSAVGGFGGGSTYGGSVYGGAQSVITPSYGMGMGGMGSNGWSTGSVIMPTSSSRSMYGGGASRSEYGGGGGGGWNSSRSSYGESFGPSPDRYSRAGMNQSRPSHNTKDSGYFPPVPPIPQGANSPAARGSPRSRTASQPANPTRGVRKGPPSSWKPSP